MDRRSVLLGGLGLVLGGVGGFVGSGGLRVVSYEVIYGKRFVICNGSRRVEYLADQLNMRMSSGYVAESWIDPSGMFNTGGLVGIGDFEFMEEHFTVAEAFGQDYFRRVGSYVI